MSGERAERFVVLNLRLMAVGLRDHRLLLHRLARRDARSPHRARRRTCGFDTPAPKTEERLWLSLGFAYMVVITFLA